MPYKTGNPALNSNTFTSPVVTTSGPLATTEPMTLEGTVGKSFILVALVLLSSAASWTQQVHNPAMGGLLILAGIIGGLITATILIFKPHLASILAPLYALCEGCALGAISYQYDAQYQGLVLQAVELTVAVLLSMLIAYSTKLIKVSEHFRLGVIAATGGIFLVYMFNMVLSMFGHPPAYFQSTSPVAIGLNLFVVIIAALNLVLDFDFIDRGTESGAPKYMEWYAGFGLLVTLVWLYMEILRLLARFRRR